MTALLFKNWGFPHKVFKGVQTFESKKIKETLQIQRFSHFLILPQTGILFVCFPVTAIAAVLSRSSMTVKRSLNELETAGLIMRVRQGVGEPNRIYVLIPGKEDAALA